MLKDGRKVKVLYTYDASQAQYIEKKMKQFLKIKDFRMPLEFEGDQKIRREELARKSEKEFDPTAMCLDGGGKHLGRK